MRFSKWNTLNKEGKKERVALVVILILLLIFSPVWNYYQNKKIEERIISQDETLFEDLKGSFKPITETPKKLDDLRNRLKDAETEEEKGNTEGNSLNTIVDKNSLK